MARKIFLILFVLAVSSSFAFGQVAITGQIRGVVTDANGGVLPNVTIGAKSPAEIAVSILAEIVQVTRAAA